MKNINLPRQRVYVRCDAWGGLNVSFEPAWLISARAVRGGYFCFQVWVDRYAACYDKVPPHTLYWKVPNEEERKIVLSLPDVQMWECLSGSVECWRKDMLADVPVAVSIGQSRSACSGKYMYTLDYIAENADRGILDIGDAPLLDEHKEANVIRLNHGQICIYPNNRIKYLPPSLTPSSACGEIPNWEVASQENWVKLSDSAESHGFYGDSSWSY